MRQKCMCLAALCMLLVAHAREVGEWHPGPARNNVSETFSPHVDYKTDLCEIAQGALLATATDPLSAGAMRNALQGMTISTAWPPAEAHYPKGLMKQDPATGAITGGAMAVLFDELARRAGIEWRSAYGIVGTDAEAYPSHQNKTWNDLIVWTTDAYDVSIDWTLFPN